MTNAQAVALLGSFILPALISFVKNQDWDTTYKQIFAIIVSAAFGFATAYFDNQIVLVWESALISMAVVVGLTYTNYVTWFEPLVEPLVRRIRNA